MVEQDVYRGTWVPPQPKAKRGAAARPKVLTFDTYAEQCIESRATRTRKPIRATTAALYRKLLRLELSPAFGRLPLEAITPADVKAWHVGSVAKGHPTQTGNAYLLLKSVFVDAVDEGLVSVTPCRLKGAGKPERAREVEALTAAEISAYLEAVPEHYRAALAIAVWCGLRSGEVRGLRVRDVDAATGLVQIRQAVSRIPGEGVIMSRPKTRAGERHVFLPPHIRPMVRAHLAALPVRGRDALVFTARDGQSPLNASTLRDAHAKGAKAIGRDSLTIHDLRRTALTLAQQVGATMAETRKMGGHTTDEMAMLYQVADDARMAWIAERMSEAAQ
ncbi:MAG: tyrosine-type recombinase/integrase [Propionibacteriaceae bacterium]|nr:tyrosine-type recombinase/integrase [Propionibacteriaceae bacterium]